MENIRKEIRQHINAVRAIDSHSHMSSIAGLDFFNNRTSLRVPGAQPDSIGIFDLLLAPYMFWGLRGFDLDKTALYTDAQKNPVAAFRVIEPYLRKWQTQGHWHCFQLALSELYDFNEEITVDNIENLDERIRSKYAGKGYYECGREILEQAGIVSSLKMIEIPWIKQVLEGRAESDEARIEREMIAPTCLIDAAVQATNPGAKISRLQSLCSALNMELKSPDDYRELIARIFSVIDDFNKHDEFGGLAGLKSATAYETDLGYLYHDDSAFDDWINNRQTDLENALPEQYLMRQVLKYANERGLTIQMHAGITSVATTNPEQLKESGCLHDFPDVNFVLLHVYPHVDAHAVMGRFNDNFYTDLSWLGLLSGSLLEDALTRLIGFSQTEKIIVGHDATCFEETYGSAIVTKKALENCLVKKVDSGYMTLSAAVDCIYDVMRNNAIDAWKLPSEKQYA